MVFLSKYRRRAGIFARWCGVLAGRFVLIAGLGALAACGFQPLALWPALLLGVAGLIYLAGRQAGWRPAGLIGWVWGIGHFSLGNNWIATAFTYQAKMPAALGMVAVVALSLFLAIYPAMAAMAAWLLRRWLRAALVPAFAGCWIIAEWLRGWLFTGFAWNPLGVALLGNPTHTGLAVLAPWLGTYGLSGLVVLLAGLAGFGLTCLATPGANRRQGAIALLLVLLAPWPAVEIARQAGHVPYTLVQPNIAQADLDDPSHFETQFVQTARLSLPRVPGQHRLVLWPESGVPDFLRPGYPRYYYRQTTFAGDPMLARLRLGRVIGAGATLLTGSVDLDMRAGDVVGARNVVTLLNGDGDITGSYAKAHLVPYGEYLPMRDWLQPLGLARLVPGDIDFLPGPGPRTLDLGDLGKVGIQICYEIIFSGKVTDRAHRPDYIFNPSNDGWFGDWYPPQLVAQARLRAIEEGLPVLRSTTNGISAVIDADGMVRQLALRDQAARLDGLVPPAHAPTLFSRMGNRLVLLWAIVLLVVSMVATRRRAG